MHCWVSSLTPPAMHSAANNTPQLFHGGLNFSKGGVASAFKSASAAASAQKGSAKLFIVKSPAKGVAQASAGGASVARFFIRTLVGCCKAHWAKAALPTTSAPEPEKPPKAL